MRHNLTVMGEKYVLNHWVKLHTVEQCFSKWIPGTLGSFVGEGWAVGNKMNHDGFIWFHVDTVRVKGRPCNFSSRNTPAEHS